MLEIAVAMLWGTFSDMKKDSVCSTAQHEHLTALGQTHSTPGPPPGEQISFLPLVELGDLLPIKRSFDGALKHDQPNAITQ